MSDNRPVECRCDTGDCEYPHTNGSEAFLARIAALEAENKKLRTPAPSSEVERAVRPLKTVIEKMRREIELTVDQWEYEIKGGRPGIVYGSRMGQLKDALKTGFDSSPIPEEKPSPLEAARSAVIEKALLVCKARERMRDDWSEAKDDGPKRAELWSALHAAGFMLRNTLDRLSALSGPTNGGEKA